MRLDRKAIKTGHGGLGGVVTVRTWAFHREKWGAGQGFEQHSDMIIPTSL